MELALFVKNGGTAMLRHKAMNMFLMFLVGSLMGYGQIKIYPHLTGDPNFTTMLYLENPTDEERVFQFVPYDKNGARVPQVLEAVPAHATRVFEKVALLDLAATHFVLGSEENPADGLSVTISYRVTEGSGSPAHYQPSFNPAETWRFYGGEWDTVYDGLAIINAGTQPVTITVSQLDLQGVVMHSEAIVTDLPVMAKALYVLGSQDGSVFAQQADSYFVVEGSGPLCVTALRGSHDSKLLWVNQVFIVEDIR